MMDLLTRWQTTQVAQDILTACIDQALLDLNVSAREIMMLRVLSTQHDGEGGHFKMKDLAARVGLSQSATTRLVTRLEERGLLVRYICPTDRRGIYTNVTESGSGVLAEAETRLLDLFGTLGFDAADGGQPETYWAKLSQIGGTRAQETEN